MFRPLTRRLARVALFVGIAIAVLAPAAAWADGTPTDPYPSPNAPQCVYPNPDPALCANPSASNTSQSQGSSLPFTGGDTLPLAAVGTVVVAGGLALVVYSRRRRAATA